MNHSKKWSKKAISMALVAAMVGTSVMPTFAASTDPNASAKREATNAAISQKAATQGMFFWRTTITPCRSPRQKERK